MILRDDEPSIRNGFDILIDPEEQIAQKYGDSACLYHIRPDGYVAFRCHAASNHFFERYLANHFVGTARAKAIEEPIKVVGSGAASRKLLPTANH